MLRVCYFIILTRLKYCLSEMTSILVVLKLKWEVNILYRVKTNVEMANRVRARRSI